MVRSTKIRV